MGNTDLVSTIESAAFATTALTVGLALFFAAHRDTPGAPWWIASNGLLALSMHLYTLRGDDWFMQGQHSPGFVFVTIWLTGVMIPLSGLANLQGFREVFGLNRLSRPMLWGITLHIVIHTWFTYVMPEVAWRALSLSCCLMIACILCGATTYRHAAQEIRGIARALVVVWMVLAGSYLLRATELTGEMLKGAWQSDVVLGRRSFTTTAAVNALCTMAAMIMAIVHQRTVSVARHNAALTKEREAAIADQRNRLSRDLHDTLSGTTAAIGILAAEGLEATDPRPALHRIRMLAGYANAEVRSLMNKLSHSTLSRQRWTAELRELANQIAEAGNLQLHWQATGLDERPIGEPLAGVHLLRAAREALHNILRHAQASELTLTTTATDHLLILTIADNGRGLHHPHTPGHGLANMQARAAELGGSLHINSTHGTCIEFTIPLPLKLDAPGKATDEVRPA